MQRGVVHQRRQQVVASRDVVFRGFLQIVTTAIEPADLFHDPHFSSQPDHQHPSKLQNGLLECIFPAVGRQLLLLLALYEGQ